MSRGSEPRLVNPRDVLPEDLWSDNFAAVLATEMVARRGGTLTWFNHYSAQQSMGAFVDVSRFSFVGIDGMLLRRLTGSAPRTSADLVLPRLLSRLRPGSRVALIGSSPDVLRRVTAHLEALPTAPRIVYARDGYAGLPAPERAARDLRELDAELVVVGLGAPLQDQYTLQLADAGLQHALIATCGGWLDQVAEPDYYPSFAYRLKLNWAIRLLREPRRMWRRYTIDAARAHRRQAELRAYLLERAGGPLARMVSACLGGHAGELSQRPPTSTARRSRSIS